MRFTRVVEGGHGRCAHDGKHVHVPTCAECAPFPYLGNGWTHYRRLVDVLEAISKRKAV